MPITNNEDNNFNGTEYLQIYPIITSEYHYNAGGSLYIEFENKKNEASRLVKTKIIIWILHNPN